MGYPLKNPMYPSERAIFLAASKIPLYCRSALFWNWSRVLTTCRGNKQVFKPGFYIKTSYAKIRDSISNTGRDNSGGDFEKVSQKKALMVLKKNHERLFSRHFLTGLLLLDKKIKTSVFYCTSSDMQNNSEYVNRQKRYKYYITII